MTENMTIVRSFVEEVLNNGKFEVIESLFVPGSLLAGGIAGQLRSMHSAFPDQSRSIETVVADGDKVVLRTAMHGTNTGPMLGFPSFGRFENPLPATGKKVITTEIWMFTLSDGKIRSLTSELDQIGILRQLGWSFLPPDSDAADALR